MRAARGRAEPAPSRPSWLGSARLGKLALQRWPFCRQSLILFCVAQERREIFLWGFSVFSPIIESLVRIRAGIHTRITGPNTVCAFHFPTNLQRLENATPRRCRAVRTVAAHRTELFAGVRRSIDARDPRAPRVRVTSHEPRRIDRRKGGQRTERITLMSAMSSSMAARVAFAPAASRVASKSGKKQRAAARRAGRTARGAHRGLVVRASDLDDELAAINAAIEALKAENDAMLASSLDSVATVVETPPPTAAPTPPPQTAAPPAAPTPPPQTAAPPAAPPTPPPQTAAPPAAPAAPETAVPPPAATPAPDAVPTPAPVPAPEAAASPEWLNPTPAAAPAAPIARVAPPAAAPASEKVRPDVLSTR